MDSCVNRRIRSDKASSEASISKSTLRQLTSKDTSMNFENTGHASSSFSEPRKCRSVLICTALWMSTCCFVQIALGLEAGDIGQRMLNGTDKAPNVPQLSQFARFPRNVERGNVSPRMVVRKLYGRSRFHMYVLSRPTT